MKLTITLMVYLCSYLMSYGQQINSNIVAEVDSLRSDWDREAVSMETYEGIKEFCKNKQHRDNTIKLVLRIHHFDSVLYSTVQKKYDINQDVEARSTLNDIDKLELEYTTKNFIKFLHEECVTVNELERNYGKSKGKEYEKGVKKLEKELVKYIDEVTLQIDIVDEHIHHLQ